MDGSSIERIKTLFESREWLKIREAIVLLADNTGPNLEFDPYVDADRLPWNSIGMSFFQSGLFMEALSVFQSLLHRYFDIQAATGKRIHKGTPYHFLGQVYLRIGNLGYAREQFLLAFVEDVLTEMQTKRNAEPGPGAKTENAFDCPAPIILEFTFRMRREMLNDLYSFMKDFVSEKNISTLLYPEQILLEWRNVKERQKENGLLVTRAVEETLFHINTHYLRDLLSSAEKDPSGVRLEELATYLFSCIDGFEPIPKQQTEAFHFDIVIRNLIKEHPLLSMLGEYIGVEVKNLDKTVSAEQLNHFIHKLRLHNIRCGIIFTNEGISGVHYEGDPKYGKNIQVKTFNRDDLIVFDITKRDVERIVDGENLISILLLKYEDIRYK